ncbi:MAG: 2-succinyl-5-enolpyruvyl-6-hydroxy-3-cyclohexene-1-carboxylic-acid synthase [Acidimicrobiia bacterium]
MTAQDVQATFCATLVDEWVRCGLAVAVVSPGSRSTPLALALAADGRLRVEVHIDERSAGFLALGVGRATGRPAVVVTTSGTAAAELHPAVAEADLDGVPLLLCTADRPAELRDVGAAQTIDQSRLFGPAVRWFAEPGVPDAVVAGRWRSLAARLVAEATGRRPGPVHANLAFREPLLGAAGPLPAAREVGPWATRSGGDAVPPLEDLVPGGLDGRRGVVVVGAGAGEPDAVLSLAGGLGWPVLPDARAAARVPGDLVVVHADAILRSPDAAAALRPEVVLRLGGLPASRVVAEWLAASGAHEVVVGGAGCWPDPAGTAATLVDARPSDAVAAWSGRGPIRAVAGWTSTWVTAERAAAAAIDEVLAAAPGPSEPSVARDLLGALPAGAQLVVSSSMPIRDLEWYAPPRRGVVVHANRGANGIDGVVSTAVGVALGSGSPTALLVGDLAFLHDSNGLLGAAGRAVDLVVVVVDNDGGGIFSLLPQAGALPDGRFEQLFGTPHGLDVVAVARALGVEARPANDVGAEVVEALERGGVHVLALRTDRLANADLHRSLSERAAAAVSRALQGG